VVRNVKAALATSNDVNPIAETTTSMAKKRLSSFMTMRVTYDSGASSLNGCDGLTKWTRVGGRERRRQPTANKRRKSATKKRRMLNDPKHAAHHEAG
jgi:hypothetical protein